MPSAPVRIHRTVLHAIIAHARDEAPLECCGLLVGCANEIMDHARAANICRSATRYQVDPADHFEAIRSARRRNLAVVGAYHSHPASAPVPSPTDLREANDPELLHLIVSLAARDPVVAAYRLADGNFDMVVLVPVP